MEKRQPDFAEQVRTNVVFEHIIASVLIGAGLGGMLIFVLGFFSAIITGGFSVSYLLPLMLSAATMSITIFLVGFFASAVVVTPLFKALEKSKRRNVWPYVAAALGISIFALIAVSQITNRAAPDLPVIIAVILAGLVIALDFGRRMRPIWRAAAEAEAASPPSHLRRLH